MKDPTDAIIRLHEIELDRDIQLTMLQYQHALNLDKAAREARPSTEIDELREQVNMLTKLVTSIIPTGAF